MPRAYDISKVTVPPKPIYQARPIYPLALRRAGANGYGLIDFYVGLDGLVHDATVKKASDVGFGQAALDSVLQWRFFPPSSMARRWSATFRFRSCSR